MKLEGTWKVTSVDELSCRRCPANWPKRKFLDYQLNIGDAFDFSKDQLTYKPITEAQPIKFKYRFNGGSFELLGGDWVAPIDLKQKATDTLIVTLEQSVLPDTGTVVENRNMFVTLSKR